MKRTDKIIAMVIGLFILLFMCSITSAALSGEVGTVAMSAASMAQSQAIEEQARALSNMADTVQTQARTNTLNLLIVMAGIIVVLYVGVRVGMQIKVQNTLTRSTAETKPLPPTRPLIVLDSSTMQTSNENERVDVAAVLATLLDSEAWK